MASCNETNGDGQAVLRHFENHLPCIWRAQISSFSVENSVIEGKAKEIEGLKLQVREILINNDDTINYMKKIGLVDTMHRIGISYHFEKDVSVELEKLFTNPDFLNDIQEYDLYTTSLLFRVFREHGFKVSCDVFNKFKENSTGKFMESLTTDVKGMLSLLEASELRLQGEDVLEEALAFTTTHLNSIPVSHISTLLQKRVTRALQQSFYKGIPRMEARIYLSFYEEDESCNELILKFAKLDFNLLQLLHKQEISLLYKWWKDMDLLSTFPYNKYVRDRWMEGYFFALVLYFEPCYSSGRMMLAKYVALVVVSDDIYDGYGTVEELQLFTDAIDKWDAKCMDQLPDYMKILYSAFMETFSEFNDEMMKNGRPYSVDHTKAAIKELLSTYNQEAKWFKKNYIPSFDEYMKTASISCTARSLISTTFIGMDMATKEVYEWLSARPKILEALEIIGRLHDDIMGTEFEPKPSAVKCYMKQYGVSQKEAIDQLWEMINTAWKNLNEGCLMPPKDVPFPLLLRFVNLARFMHAGYKHDDGFDHPEAYKEFINPILLDPVPL